MKRVSAAEANRHFSRILREVAAGERVIVTSRGKPVAEIKAARDTDEEDQQRLRDWRAFIERLRSQPAQNLGKFNRDDAYD